MINQNKLISDLNCFNLYVFIKLCEFNKKYFKYSK